MGVTERVFFTSLLCTTYVVTFSCTYTYLSACLPTRHPLEGQVKSGLKLGREGVHRVRPCFGSVSEFTCHCIVSSGPDLSLTPESLDSTS